MSDSHTVGRRYAAIPRCVQLSPLSVVATIATVVAASFSAFVGLQPFVQTTINGLVSGVFLALGAVGLTLVYGVVRFVNFAHGDMLTFGAYMGASAIALGLSFIEGVVFAVVATAALALVLEVVLWRPMRRKGAGLFQLFVMSLGLAFVLRYTIQFFAGSEPRTLNVDVTSTVTFGWDLRVGRTQLIMAAAGAAVIIGIAAALRATSLGRQVRAVSDNTELAEATGVNSSRIILVVWLLSGALAGLAGMLFGASLGVISPQFGYEIILSLFAAMIIGGIGNAYGALAGGILIGLSQEWATLVIDPSLKVAVGFIMMFAALVLRPQGLFGHARGAEE